MMLRAYVAERLPLRLIVPVASALAFAAGGERTAWQLATDATLALSLFVQFRLWDDIADRVRDSVDHPSRVLVRAASVRPFATAVVTLGIVNVAYLAWRSVLAAALYLALVTVFAAWYGRRTERTAAGTHLLLAKYPALVAVVAATRTVAHPMLLLVSLVVVYVAACLYEAWHDSSFRIFRLKAEATQRLPTPLSWLPPSGGRSAVISPKRDATAPVTGTNATADIGVQS